jgi:mRNA interferase RelE/StbE
MYSFQIEDGAKKSFKTLDKPIQRQILKFFANEHLLQNPKSFGKPLLYNRKGYWRYRIEDYRVICKIMDGELIVLAIDIGHRKDVYKR